MQLSYTFVSLFAFVLSVQAAASVKADYHQIGKDGAYCNVMMSALQIRGIFPHDNTKVLLEQVGAHCNELAQCTGFSFNKIENLYYRVTY